MRRQRGYLTGWWTIFEAIAVMAGLILLYMIAGYGDAKATPTVEQLEVHAAKVEIDYDLPAGLLRAICEQESRWRNVAGQHGEIGVCQIKPDTVLMICDCKNNGRQVFFQSGSRGDEVRRIQAQITRWGFPGVKVDGVYGPETARAVAGFQRALGAKPDGVIGPVTWALLFQGEPYPGGTIAAALWNPYKNIEWAAAYLVWIRANVSDDPVVLMAAYNGGPANPVVKYVVSVQRRIARGSM